MRITQISEASTDTTFGYDLEDNTQSKLFMLRCILEVMKQKIPQINPQKVIDTGDLTNVLKINTDNDNSRAISFGLGFTIYDIFDLRDVVYKLDPNQRDRWALYWVKSYDKKDKIAGLADEISEEMKEAGLPYLEPSDTSRPIIVYHKSFENNVKTFINSALDGSGYALKMQTVTDIFGPVMKMKIVEYQAPSEVQKLKDFKAAMKQNKFEAFRAKYKISKIDFANMLLTSIAPKNQISATYKEKLSFWLSKILGE